MIELGARATLDDATRLVGARALGHDWLYEQVSGTEPLRHALLARGKFRSIGFDPLGEPLRSFAVELAERYEIPVPRAAYCHRNLELPYHRDRLMPYECRNATVFLRDEMSDGAMVLDLGRGQGIGFRCDDSWMLLFDGQTLHGVAPMTARSSAGYRFALTFYVPREESA